MRNRAARRGCRGAPGVSGAGIDWLRAAPAHAREYLALTAFVEYFGHIAKEFTTPTAELLSQARAEPEAVQSLFQAVDQSHGRDTPAPEFTPRCTGVWATPGGIAAALAMVVLFGAWWLHDRADYSTAHAEQRSWHARRLNRAPEFGFRDQSDVRR